MAPYDAGHQPVRRRRLGVPRCQRPTVTPTVRPLCPRPGSLGPGVDRRLRRRRHRSPARAGRRRPGSPGCRSRPPVVAANRAADARSRPPVPTSSSCSSTRAPRPPRCASATDPGSDFGGIVNGADGDIDAIVSGHTHLAYNHSIPCGVDRRPARGHDRPVVSAGQYGYNLNQLLFTVRRPATGDVVAVDQQILPLRQRRRRTRPTRRPQADRRRRRRRGRGARRRRARPDRRPVQPGDRRLDGRHRPHRRTAAASRRSATWSPKCSGGRPSRRPPAAPRSRS